MNSSNIELPAADHVVTGMLPRSMATTPLRLVTLKVPADWPVVGSQSTGFGWDLHPDYFTFDDMFSAYAGLSWLSIWYALSTALSSLNMYRIVHHDPQLNCHVWRHAAPYSALRKITLRTAGELNLTDSRAKSSISESIEILMQHANLSQSVRISSHPIYSSRWPTRRPAKLKLLASLLI